MIKPAQQNRVHNVWCILQVSGLGAQGHPFLWISPKIWFNRFDVSEEIHVMIRSSSFERLLAL